MQVYPLAELQLYGRDVILGLVGRALLSLKKMLQISGVTVLNQKRVSCLSQPALSPQRNEQVNDLGHTSM